MRRVGHLYEAIAETQNLLEAFHGARRGKRDRHAVRRFGARLWPNLMELRRELVEERVCWHGYRLFHIRDPKPRRIAAPAFRDRVLHHAIVRVVEPHLERVAVFDSYACRRGKGVYAAIERAQVFARRHPWFCHLDARRYFDSIDHAVLKGQLARLFKDRALLGLLGGLIESYETAPGKGLPIGSLASQHLANFYLAPLDHFATEVLRAPGYLRYMDDFVLFGESREQVVEGRARVREFLGRVCALELRDAGALGPSRDGLAFCGMLIRPSHVRLVGRAKRRTRRRLRGLVRGYREGRVGTGELARRTEALLARTRHVSARGLRASWVREFAGLEA